MNNLKLGVCWIEDQPSEPETAAVKEVIKGCGFEPNIEIVGDMDGIKMCRDRQRKFQEYELILLDLRLGDVPDGDTLAVTIRQDFRSTPILFYSAMPVDELRARMANRGVDGVYCAPRGDLVNRVRELVTDLTPRLNRLSSMRGLAAQVVGECDEEFRRVLRGLARSRSSESSVARSLVERAERGIKDRLADLDASAGLEKVLEGTEITSVILFREVRSRLKSDDSEQIGYLLHRLKEYEEKVLRRRNVLAHAVEKKTDERWIIVRSGAGADVTEGDFEEYRADFLLFRECARQLRELIAEETEQRLPDSLGQ